MGLGARGGETMKEVMTPTFRKYCIGPNSWFYFVTVDLRLLHRPYSHILQGVAKRVIDLVSYMYLR